jgi:hypothetical protein
MRLCIYLILEYRNKDNGAYLEEHNNYTIHENEFNNIDLHQI